jgi:3-deoxy-D-manno-octulosonic-acid transferase
MYVLYSAVMAALALVWLPSLLARRRRVPDERLGLAERLGRFGPELPAAPRCWVHAVSVGEVAVAVPLVEGLLARRPDLGVVMTTVTPTGAQLVRDRLRGRAVHRYFPLDLPGPVGRALDAVRPEFCIVMETELWPNFLRALRRRRIPGIVANGRISDRSFRRYQWVRWLMRRALADVAVFAMQSDEDARRIIALGAPSARVVVTGNLKTDLTPDGSRDADWPRRLGLERGERLWIAGSTHRGEDALVLAAFEAVRAEVPGVRLLLAPRHPERAPEVEQLAVERGLPLIRRTALNGTDVAGKVVLLDTVGELAALYAFAEVVFVGGSLVPAGGHNMLEPALARKPVLFGPHTENFRDAARLLLDAGAAVVVGDGPALARELGRLLRDPALRARMGEAGFAAVSARRGGVQATIDLVERAVANGGGEVRVR